MTLLIGIYEKLLIKNIEKVKGGRRELYNFIESKSDVINTFSAKKKEGHIFQTVNWSEFKSDWNDSYFYGENENKEVVLSCCLLSRNIPYLNKKIGYIPRGFVCDYSNEKLIEEFIIFLKEYAKKNKIAFITMDPEIHLNINGEVVEFAEKIEEFLISLGLKNLSKGSMNFETIQPNFTFKLDISKRDGESIEDTKKRIFKGFHSKCRYKVKIGSERSLNVEVYDSTNITEKEFDIFQDLMNTTGERDGFIVRKKNYFESIIEKLYPYAEMYLVKYSPSEDKKNAIKKLETLTNQKVPLEKKLLTLREELYDLSLLEVTEESNKKISKIESKITTTNNKLETIVTQINNLTDRISMLNESGDEDVYLSGAIYLHFGDKGWYLYGASSNEFRDAMPNYTMQWAMIQKSIELGKDVYDFWGAPGDTSEDNHLHGLYKFKKSFGGDFIEHIGEYDLVINNTTYVLFKKAFPKFKKIRGKLKHK